MSLILTEAGRDAHAQAEATGVKLQATHMAVGDGGGKVVAHTDKSEALVNETWRGELQEIEKTASAEVEFTGHVPITVGGWYIREVGVYAGDTLLAVGNHPETWKPAPESPDKVELVITGPVKFANTDNISFTVDTTKVLASQEHVAERLKEHDAAQDAHPPIWAALESRVKLISSNETIHVKTTGNDATGDGTDAKPFATPQAALKHLSRYVIPATVSVMISIGAGTYNLQDGVVINHRDGARIKIVGAGSTATVLHVPDNHQGMSIYGAVGLIDQLTIKRPAGTALVSGWLLQAATVLGNMSDVVIDGFADGLTAYRSRLGFGSGKLVTRNIARDSVVMDEHSVAHLPSSDFGGCGGSHIKAAKGSQVYAYGSAFGDAAGAVVDATSGGQVEISHATSIGDTARGVLAQDPGSMVLAPDCRFGAVTHNLLSSSRRAVIDARNVRCTGCAGMIAVGQSGGYMYLDGLIVPSGTRGMWAEDGGQIRARGARLSGLSHVGIGATRDGYIDCTGSFLRGTSAGQAAFFASEHGRIVGAATCNVSGFGAASPAIGAGASAPII